MSDTISRQAAIDALNDEFTIIGKTNAIVVQDYIRRINNRLHDLPSAQPERKTGRWYDVGSLSCRCSECGCKSQKKSLFCPWCGAMMKGELDEGQK